jgi:potassium/hydrogen antiporter
MSDGELILIAGALTVAGLVASVAADRLRVPGLVLFLGLGMAIGSDGTGWIDFTDYELARTIGVIALALILFEGGLTTSFGELRSVAAPALSLAFAGTLLTALTAGIAATWLFDFSLLEGLLLGSIVSATDGAAIFALVRNSNLDRRVGLTLEGESGFNDPLSVLLVIGLIDWIQKPDFGASDMLVLLLRELGIGLVVGLAVGWLAVQGLRRARLRTEAAYPIATLSVAALAYGGAAALHGSGFLSVYLAGVWLGSAPIPAERAVSIFHQGLAGLAQVTMFLVLGLLVFPSQLWGVALEGTVLALVLMFLARPVAAFAATAATQFDLRERGVLAWAGLRGAVPVVLATFPVIAAVSQSLEFFNIVFFAVLLSTLLQGATFEPLANRLGVTVVSGAESAAHAALGRLRSIPRISTSRPWDPADGNPAHPRQVNGIPVTRQVLTRIDEAGALVQLEDGRYAFCGPTVSIGSARALQAAARRRLAAAESEADRAWWREIIGALARGSG